MVEKHTSTVVLVVVCRFLWCYCSWLTPSCFTSISMRLPAILYIGACSLSQLVAMSAGVVASYDDIVTYRPLHPLPASPTTCCRLLPPSPFGYILGRVSYRQSDEIKHVWFFRPSVRPVGRSVYTIRSSDRPAGQTSRTDRSVRRSERVNIQ